tara:strand:- start:122 stop:406 length:285 start_codon:yes stop_codon:yes gene_type:complete
MTSLNTIPRNQRYQDEEPAFCYQCGTGFHSTDKDAMTTSVYWHFEGEEFCSPMCLHDRKGGVCREEWRRRQEPEEEGSSNQVDDYGYPMSLYND